MTQAPDRQDQFQQAILRAYRAAGRRLPGHEAEILAGVYARWSAGADDGVVARVEAKLLASLAVPAG